VGREVSAGNGWWDEGRGDKDDPTAVGEMATRLQLEAADGMDPHRHLVVERDGTGLDAGVLRELPGNRVAKPAILHLPRGLMDRNRGDAEIG
jgi:hypothetical protein